MRYCRGPVPEWIAGLEIRVRQSKPRPTTDDKRAARYESAIVMLAKWQRRERLAKTKVRKWSKRVRVLTASMAARPAVSPGEEGS